MILPFGSYPYDGEPIVYQFLEKPKKFRGSSNSKSVRRAKKIYLTELKRVKRALKIKKHEIYARLNRASTAFKNAKNCGSLEEAKIMIRNDGICFKSEFVDNFTEAEPLIRDFRGLVTEIEEDEDGALLFHVRSKINNDMYFRFVVFCYYLFPQGTYEDGDHAWFTRSELEELVFDMDGKGMLKKCIHEQILAHADVIADGFDYDPISGRFYSVNN